MITVNISTEVYLSSQDWVSNGKNVGSTLIHLQIIGVVKSVGALKNVYRWYCPSHIELSKAGGDHNASPLWLIVTNVLNLASNPSERLLISAFNEKINLNGALNI